MAAIQTSEVWKDLFHKVGRQSMAAMGYLENISCYTKCSRVLVQFQVLGGENADEREPLTKPEGHGVRFLNPWVGEVIE